jgi:RES domain-containing protein
LRFRGRCFRAHDPGWSFDPLSGEGARLRGGRFNAKGKAALYLSLRVETAVGECAQGFVHRIPPLTLCEYEVDCDPIADLSSDERRAAHGVAMAELGCPWLMLMLNGEKVLSQEVAKRLEGEGHAGMLVPSFFPGAGAKDVNLILWRWGDRLPARVRVHDPERRLPRNRRSWE